LALPFLKLQVDHLDLLFLLADLLFTVLENLLLNVGLLVKDAQLIVAINQLDTHVVSALTSLLVLINKIVHFLLQRVNDQVELIRLVNLLTDDVLLLFEFVLILVQFSLLRITFVLLLLNVQTHVHECPVLIG